MIDEEAAIEDRYRSMQTHKGSVASEKTLIGDNIDMEKKGEKEYSWSSTLEVTELQVDSGRSTPFDRSRLSRSRASTMVDLPQLKEVVAEKP